MKTAILFYNFWENFAEFCEKFWKTYKMSKEFGDPW